jgi:hypothetical protein
MAPLECIKRRGMFMRAAGCSIGAGRGSTWRPRETNAGSSPDDEGGAAASLPSGYAVHAGYDYASCAGG